MKKLWTLLALALAMFLGMNDVTAQTLTEDQDRPEVIAKQKVADLSTQLDLTADQQRTLFRAMVGKEVAYKKYVVGKDLSNTEVAAHKKRADELLATAMKKHLTATQYQKWVDLQKQ